MLLIIVITVEILQDSSHNPRIARGRGRRRPEEMGGQREREREGEREMGGATLESER